MIRRMDARDLCGRAGPLWELIERYPELREVFRQFSPKFVPVALNTCTLPQQADGTLRDDCLVYGLFFVDRSEVAKAGSIKVIRQDYFVVSLASGAMRYFSGEKAEWKTKGRPVHWRPIREFCKEFRGPGGCYGCQPRPKRELPAHWFPERDAGLRRMKPQPVWRLAFELASATAQRL